MFAPLAADARAAELVVPFMVVAEQTEETKLTMPIGGKQVGDSIPLDTALSLGSYPLIVRDAAILEQQSGQQMLALRLDLGDWRERPQAIRTGTGESEVVCERCVISMLLLYATRSLPDPAG